MNTNQQELLNIIQQHFKDKSFYFSDLKQYGSFYPATITSLVKMNYLAKDQINGKSVYRLRGDKQFDPMFEVEYKGKQAEAILTHLENSHNSWKKQLEDLGIEFPEEEYQVWADLVKKRTNSFLSSVQTSLSLLSSLDSAF